MFLPGTVIYVKVSVFFIICIQQSFDCHPIHMMFPNTIFPFFFKLPLMFQNHPIYKAGHPFDHDHKTITMIVHCPDIFFTEISSVENKSYFFIAISHSLTEHKFKLFDISYTSRIRLIKQRFCIPGIICDRVVKYRCPNINLRHPIFNHFYFTGSAVLVCRVI